MKRNETDFSLDSRLRNAGGRASIHATGAVAALFCLTPIFAQETATMAENEIVELDQLVVSGEVYAFGAQKIGYVHEADLTQIQASDLQDIFAFDPSIQVGGGFSAAEKIYIRGVEDKLLNVTIDGEKSKIVVTRQ